MGTSGALATLTRIAESILTAPAASIDFDAIPPTFRHLHLTGLLRTDVAATAEFVDLALNGDTTAADYDYQQVSATGVVASAFYGASTRSVAYVCGATATADQYASVDVDIPGYRGSTRKVCEWASGCPTAAGVTLVIVNAATLWKSTAAVTRITLTPAGGGNFAAGSLLSLYGLA